MEKKKKKMEISPSISSPSFFQRARISKKYSNRFAGNVICIHVYKTVEIFHSDHYHYWFRKRAWLKRRATAARVDSGLFARAAAATRLFAKNLTFPFLIVRRGTEACFGQRRRGGPPWRKVRTPCPRCPWRYPSRLGTTRRRRIPRFKFRGDGDNFSIDPPSPSTPILVIGIGWTLEKKGIRSLLFSRPFSFQIISFVIIRDEQMTFLSFFFFAFKRRRGSWCNYI